MRRQYFEEKCYGVVKLWECERLKVLKPEVSVNHRLRESFPYKHPLLQDHLLDKKKSRALFGYVQCDIKFPEHLREKFAIFPQIFKNTNVCRQDFGPLVQEYAKKEGIMSRLWRMLFSSFDLANGTIIPPLPLFYMELGLFCTKTYRFVEYTPVKCLDIFVESAVNARRHGDENPRIMVVAETLKVMVYWKKI